MLQETWLTKTNCTLVNIPGYKHIFVHRTGKQGGSVSLLVNNEYTCRKCDDLCINEPFLECCTAEIKLPHSKIFVSSVYRPPNTKESKFNTEIDRLLKSISKRSNLGLIGLDHNLDLLKSATHKPTQKFLETVLSTLYIPCITRPTGITRLSATLIDNILVSHDIYTNINSGIAISDLSDHLHCIMTSSFLKHQQKGSIRINKNQGSQLASCRAVFCAGFHVVTSTTHGVHMDTTWHPCGNPVVSCRNHIVSTFETLCCPPGNQMVSTLKPHGVHMEPHNIHMATM